MDGENKEQERTDGTSMESLPRWLRDLIDYNDELAGRDTGRRQRFLVSGEDVGRDALEKKQQRRFDELLRLLQNPTYAKLYYQAVDTIERVDIAVDRARQKLSRESEIAATQLNKLRERAAELPDGRKVFRAKDGRFIADDGTDVTGQQGSIKGLSAETPYWEEFTSAQTRLQEIQQQLEEIDDYIRDVIDPVRARLADPENPMTPDELIGFHSDVKEKAPQALRADVNDVFEARVDAKSVSPTNSSAAEEYVGPAGLGTPDLLEQFSIASPGLTGDAFASPAREPYGSQATQLPATSPKT